MSNRILDDLLTFLAGQGLTMQVLAEAPYPNFRLLQGPDNRPLSALHIKTLKEGIRSYRSEQRLKSLASPNKVSREGNLINYGSEEACMVLVPKTYQGSDLDSLIECAPGEFKMSEVSTTISISSVVARGTMRVAYRAELVDFHRCCEIRGWYVPGEEHEMYYSWSILKAYNFFGGDNTLNMMKDQAHVQAVANAFAEIFNEVVKRRDIQARRIFYLPVIIVTRPDISHQFCHTLVPEIKGKYIKFDRTVVLNELQEEMYLILQTFSHFTYYYSRGRALVTNINGAVGCYEYILTDPTIHTAWPQKILKHPSNLGAAGISAFFKEHACNDMCRTLSLKPPKELYSSA